MSSSLLTCLEEASIELSLSLILAVEVGKSLQVSVCSWDLWAELVEYLQKKEKKKKKKKKKEKERSKMAWAIQWNLELESKDCCPLHGSSVNPSCGYSSNSLPRWFISTLYVGKLAFALHVYGWCFKRYIVCFVFIFPFFLFNLCPKFVCFERLRERD